MVVTQWAFVGPALLWPDRLGMASGDGAAGLVYTMGMVGRQLGICDRLNFCLAGVEHATACCRLLHTTVIQPGFAVAEAAPVCREMAGHTLAGVNMLNPFIGTVYTHRY